MKHFYEHLDALMLRDNSMQAFSLFVNQKFLADKTFLNQIFWKNGRQHTLLTYLIDLHQSEQMNLIEHVQFLLDKGISLTDLFPAHDALLHQKLDLLTVLLNERQAPEVIPEGTVFNNIAINSHNLAGQTLLSLALESMNTSLINKILDKNPDVNLPAMVNGQEIQPLVLAIIKNLAISLKRLLTAGASVANPSGEQCMTPLHIAAFEGRDVLLKALVEHEKSSDLNYESVARSNLCAVDLLCQRLHEGKPAAVTLKCMAILLCRGAEAPFTDADKVLLMNNRTRLLTYCLDYLKDNPELKRDFYRRCKNKSDALHGIFYAEEALGTKVRHFLGQVKGNAARIESLVPDYHGISDDSVFEENERKFAEFMRLYNKDYQNSWLGNPWSQRRLEMDKGIVSTWSQVVTIASRLPNTRTGRIVAIMTELEQSTLKSQQTL